MTQDLLFLYAEETHSFKNQLHQQARNFCKNQFFRLLQVSSKEFGYFHSCQNTIIKKMLIICTMCLATELQWMSTKLLKNIIDNTKPAIQCHWNQRLQIGLVLYTVIPLRLWPVRNCSNQFGEEQICPKHLPKLAQHPKKFTQILK